MATVGVSLSQKQQDRFWGRVVKSKSCWNWTGSKFQSGYGRFKVGVNGSKRETVAHLFAYEMLVGTVSKGLELDHRCRNRLCVRPDHLEAISHQLNEIRGNTIIAENAMKTRCLRGHDLFGTNLFIRRDGRRMCRQCHRDGCNRRAKTLAYRQQRNMRFAKLRSLNGQSI